MSGVETDDRETQEYRVVHTPIGDTQPGETIELDAATASAFEDNLADPDEDTDADGAVRSQVVGARGGPMTLSDMLDSGEIESIDDGEQAYVVVGPEPVDGTPPGGTVELSAPVAVAFADNLRPPDVDSETDTGAPPAVNTGNDTNGDSGGDAPPTYDSPEAFVDRTPATEVANDIESGDFTADQLDAIATAERESGRGGDDGRATVMDAIDAQHLEE